MIGLPFNGHCEAAQALPVDAAGWFPQPFGDRAPRIDDMLLRILHTVHAEGVCCSQSPAQSSQTSAQSAHRRMENAEFRPIHCAANRQMSASRDTV